MPTRRLNSTGLRYSMVVESGTTLLVAIEIQNNLFGEGAVHRSFIDGGSMNTFQANTAAKFIDCGVWNYFIGHN
jgi:hypothetical protein